MKPSNQVRPNGKPKTQGKQARSTRARGAARGRSLAITLRPKLTFNRSLFERCCAQWLTRGGKLYLDDLLGEALALWAVKEGCHRTMVKKGEWDWAIRPKVAAALKTKSAASATKAPANGPGSVDADLARWRQDWAACSPEQKRTLAKMYDAYATVFQVAAGHSAEAVANVLSQSFATATPDVLKLISEVFEGIAQELREKEAVFRIEAEREADVMALAHVLGEAFKSYRLMRREGDWSVFRVRGALVLNEGFGKKEIHRAANLAGVRVRVLARPSAGLLKGKAAAGAARN